MFVKRLAHEKQELGKLFLHFKPTETSWVQKVDSHLHIVGKPFHLKETGKRAKRANSMRKHDRKGVDNRNSENCDKL